MRASCAQLEKESKQLEQRLNRAKPLQKRIAALVRAKSARETQAAECTADAERHRQYAVEADLRAAKLLTEVQSIKAALQQAEAEAEEARASRTPAQLQPSPTQLLQQVLLASASNSPLPQSWLQQAALLVGPPPTTVMDRVPQPGQMLLRPDAGAAQPQTAQMQPPPAQLAPPQAPQALTAGQALDQAHLQQMASAMQQTVLQMHGQLMQAQWPAGGAPPMQTAPPAQQLPANQQQGPQGPPLQTEQPLLEQETPDAAAAAAAAASAQLGGPGGPPPPSAPAPALINPSGASLSGRATYQPY